MVWADLICLVPPSKSSEDQSHNLALLPDPHDNALCCQPKHLIKRDREDSWTGGLVGVEADPIRAGRMVVGNPRPVSVVSS